jgi:hypothetical protein
VSDYYCIGCRRFMSRANFARTPMTASGLSSWCNTCGPTGENAPRLQQTEDAAETEELRNEVAELRRQLGERT